MQANSWYLALGLSLAVAMSARAEITKGVLIATGGQMPWWGGLVRDTIARQSGVDKDSIKYEVERSDAKYRTGTIIFAMQKGKSLDLARLHDDLIRTRLGKGTRSGVNSFQVTATGEVTLVDKTPLLKVSGAADKFTLAEDPKAKPKEGAKTPYQRLQEALAKGQKVVSVTGRLQSWSGTWPATLRALSEEIKANKPQVLIVTDFETAAK